MAKDVKKEILKKLKAETGGKRNIKFPTESIKFEETNSATLQMTFTARKYIEGEKKGKKYVNYNMQGSGVCFEAWAVIIKTYCPQYEKIILAVENVNGLYDKWLATRNGKKARNGHVGRFFYRALRFSEQYDWFELDSELQKEVYLFKNEWLMNRTLCNNIPQGKPGNSKGKVDENYFEKQLAESGTLYKLIIGADDLAFDENDEMYRQLPVGLFEDKVASVNTVFTGGKSAIDMWTYHGDTIYPIELKYDNEMVGIITEIFFYANFLWDLVRTGGFRISPVTKDKERKEAKERGYDYIKEGCYRKVSAILLSDSKSYHPLVTDKVMATLNAVTKGAGNVPISYTKCSYEVDEHYKAKVQR